MAKITDIENLLLTEIRLNRTSIKELSDQFNKDRLVTFSNKIKVGIIMAGISLFMSIIVIILVEKFKASMI